MPQNTPKITLQTVIANLENTIAGKRALLDNMQYYSDNASSIDVTSEFLRINITELKQILDDLKQIPKE